MRNRSVLYLLLAAVLLILTAVTRLVIRRKRRRYYVVPLPVIRRDEKPEPVHAPATSEPE